MIEALVSREAAGRYDDNFPAGDVIAHDFDDSVPRYVREVVVAEVLKDKGNPEIQYPRSFAQKQISFVFGY